MKYKVTSTCMDELVVNFIFLKKEKNMKGFKSKENLRNLLLCEQR